MTDDYRRLSRVFAKKLHLALGGEIISATTNERVDHDEAVTIVLSQLKCHGATDEEVALVKEAVDGRRDSEVGYNADYWGYDDGPCLGTGIPFDEGVYEELKDVFRRIDAAEIAA